MYIFSNLGIENCCLYIDVTIYICNEPSPHFPHPHIEMWEWKLPHRDLLCASVKRLPFAHYELCRSEYRHIYTGWVQNNRLFSCINLFSKMLPCIIGILITLHHCAQHFTVSRLNSSTRLAFTKSPKA